MDKQVCWRSVSNTICIVDFCIVLTKGEAFHASRSVAASSWDHHVLLARYFLTTIDRLVTSVVLTELWFLARTKYGWIAGLVSGASMQKKQMAFG